MEQKNTKAQTWSFDLIIAVVLFIVVVALFYSFLSADTFEDETSKLESSAELIITQLNCDTGGNDDVCIINKGRISGDLDSLGKWQAEGYDYDEIRTDIGVSSYFCIYLRTPDGALVPLPGNWSSVGRNTTALTADINGQQVRCGEQLP